jgi:hypothetical protein
MLLLDNDDAADPVYASIRKLTNNKSASRNVPFVHVAGNLYAVITPLKLGKTKTIIEDCFADEIKNLSLGGKTFNPSNKADPSKYFSKHILSQYVRQNAGKIDFSGFVNLLDRIVAAILHHQGFKAGSLVADVSDAATTQP